MLLTNWFLDPIVYYIGMAITLINGVVHSPAISLVLLAFLIRLAFWPLNVAQFKSMLGMQKLAPKLKRLQARYKGEPQKLQQETMALYQSEGVNPLAGCWPTLLQLPVLFSVYWAVTQQKTLFTNAHFLWIGSPLAHEFPKFVAASLAHADIALIVLYILSQYLSMRYTMMPPTDEAQAQQMKIMQIVSPLMFGFFSLRAQWPSAMVLYWLSFNVFTMAQQLYLLRRYHQPFAAIDSEHAIVDDVPSIPAAANTPKTPVNGSLKGATKGKKRKKA